MSGNADNLCFSVSTQSMTPAELIRGMSQLQKKNHTVNKSICE